MNKKKKIYDRGLTALTAILTTLAGCSFSFWALHPEWIPYGLAALAAVNLLPLLSLRKFPSFRVRLCNHGVICLRAWGWSLLCSALWHLATFRIFPFFSITWLWSLLLCLCVETVLYWNGMLCINLTSLQLGLGKRAVGYLLRKVLIVKPFLVRTAIRTASEEVAFEEEKHRLNLSRKADTICRTRYPILLVRGVFFRDGTLLNYWGRIPKELEHNGATIFYGNHQSADSVAGSAREIRQRIRDICALTGCEKVNIIAHSKGGLDCRAAISDPETAKMVASLTTINTPHRGCQFADYLLNCIPQEAQKKIAAAYNASAKKRGDFAPDFMGAVRDLTASCCCDFDSHTPAPAGVLCQSVGSKLNHPTDGSFPLNFSAQLVKHFDGANDGLVGENAFQWGEHYIFLSTDTDRGISHGDVVDQNRENIPGFDVREFYVQLVADLKKKGL